MVTECVRRKPTRGHPLHPKQSLGPQVRYQVQLGNEGRHWIRHATTHVASVEKLAEDKRVFSVILEANPLFSLMHA